MLGGAHETEEMLEKAGLLPLPPTCRFGFWIAGDPVPWARAGGGLSMRRFTPPRQRAYANRVKDAASRVFGGRRLIEGPVELVVLGVWAYPASWPAKRRESTKWMISRPDIDNACLKLVMDSLNKIVWRDDCQVASQHAWKIYGDRPRLAVHISQLEAG